MELLIFVGIMFGLYKFGMRKGKDKFIEDTLKKEFNEWKKRRFDNKE